MVLVSVALLLAPCAALSTVLNVGSSGVPVALSVAAAVVGGGACVVLGAGSGTGLGGGACAGVVDTVTGLDGAGGGVDTLCGRVVTGAGGAFVLGVLGVVAGAGAAAARGRGAGFAAPGAGAIGASGPVRAGAGAAITIAVGGRDAMRSAYPSEPPVTADAATSAAKPASCRRVGLPPAKTPTGAAPMATGIGAVVTASPLSNAGPANTPVGVCSGRLGGS